MVRSIFFKPDRREENALTHRFLAIYERLSDDGRYLLLKNCKVEFIHKLGRPRVIRERPKLREHEPDGLLEFADTVVVFENKLDTVHKSEENTKRSQLRTYYDHLKTEYPGYERRMLVAADGRFQSCQQIESIIKKQGIPEDEVDIILWQDLHHSCLVWAKSLTSNMDSKSLQTTELDRFLVEELRVLLEEMKMVTYTGIEFEDFEGFTRSRGQLRVLEKYLTTEIQNEFDMLKRSGKRNFGNILYTYLGFYLKNASDHVKTYVRFYVAISPNKDEGFKIGIWISTQELTSKLQGEDLEKLISFVNQLEASRALIGSKRELVDLHKRLLESKSDKIDDFFDGFLKLEKWFSFEVIQKELGLNTPMFPQNLMKEILKLKPIITLLNQVLTEK